jgi:prophage antirepressor-like protein
MEIEKILNQSKAIVTTDLSKRSGENFKYIRTLKIEKKEYFIARDIANLLGYAIPRKAVREHCKKAVSFGDIFKRSKIDPLDLAPVLGNSWKQTKLIQESDIWRLILRSKLPEAEKIEEWIMEEVLPSIRKNGFYISETAKKNPSKALIDVASSIMKTRLVTVEKRNQLLSLIENFLDSQTEYKPNSLSTVISNVYQYLHIATSLKTAVMVIEDNLINSKNGLKINSYNPKQERAYDRDYLVAVNYYTEKQLAVFDDYFQGILEDVVRHLKSLIQNRHQNRL